MTTLSSILLWSFGLLAFWLFLSAGDIASLIVGLPAIALAILLIRGLSRGDNDSDDRVSIIAAIRFAYFFITESLRGGLDVSLRVLKTAIPIESSFYDYTMQLRNPKAQQLFITSISLLPGSLCADKNENQLRIHALDRQDKTEPGIQRLESLVSQIFGESR